MASRFWKCSLLVCCLIGFPSEGSAQGIVDAFIAGAEAGLREQQAQASIELLKLQREILAETYRQQIAAGQQRQLHTMRVAEEAKQRQAALAVQVKAETDVAMRTFTMRRPDWKPYEQAILSYAAKMPAGSLGVQDYLDALYFLAKRDMADAALRTAAEEQAHAVLDQFSKRHADWKNYDEQMTAIAQVRPPDPGMTDLEYLELLYTAAHPR